MVCALGAYALDRWVGLLDPRPTVVVVATPLVALGAGLVLAGRRRITGRGRRGALAAATGLLAAALVLRAAGVPGRLLAPWHWPGLVGHLAGGIGALPQASVPYAGTDATRHVIALCGAGLLLIAALSAVTRPAGRRATTLLGLAVLFGVPAVQVPPAHPWLSGALFAVGIGAVLHADRLSARRAPLTAGAVVAAAVAGALLAPHVRAGSPLVDLQELGAVAVPRGGEVYRWNQDYRPLSWPQDGRVVLRIRARAPAYWKAESLEDFDGTGWRAAAQAPGPDTQMDPAHPDWRERIDVRFGRLRGAQFVAAGSTWFIDHAPRKPVPGTAGSLIAQRGVLGPQSSYRALVYVPRPTATEMRQAGTDYPSYLLRDLTMGLPGGGRVQFAPWAADGLPPAAPPPALARSPYLRAWELAQSLRRRAVTPYDFVAAVQRRLLHGYAYDTAPPSSRYPLLSFLFSTRRGYCQHFSGAMALLLRMGGVPARVAAGFSPGGYDRHSHQWVVRDTDAHAWVEAYFPQIGWVTFDPTPATAAARDRFAMAPAPAGPRGGGGGSSPASSRLGEPSHVVRPAHPAPPAAHRLPPAGNPASHAAAGGGLPAAAIVALVLLGLAGAAALGAGLVAGRRRPAPGAAEELERALARAGRPARPGATLRDLERLLHDVPGAAGYLRALSANRYGGARSGPTAEDRRALRHALAYGLGVRGRLRALYALPPRPALFARRPQP